MSPLPGIILAAGLSRRMEGKCKLLLPFRGRAMVAHAARAALDGGLNPVVLVVGPHSPSEVAQACLKEASAENGRIRVATAERAAMGQAESLKAGLTFMRKLAPDAPGVMVLLGDLPLVDGDLVQRLASAFLAAYHEQNAPFCVVPRAEREGRRGNPAVLHAGLFADVTRLSGDVGARRIIAAHPLLEIPCAGDACLSDADTPEAYAALLERTDVPEDMAPRLSRS